MSWSQVWEETDSAPWVKELNGKTKLLLLLLFAVLTIVVDNPRSLFLIFLAALGLHLLARTSLAKWQVMAFLIMLGLWGSMFSQALFFTQMPRTPILTIIPTDFPVLGPLTNGLFVYREGLIYGAVQGMRSATMLALGLFICWSSDPRQLLRAMMSWKLPPQVSFMLVTALRFLPSLAAEGSEVLVALRLRSGTKAGRVAVVRHLPYIAKPLLARCLRRSNTLALSVVSRGFFLNKGQAEETWPWREKASLAVLMVLVLLLCFCKAAYILSEQGYYVGQLRPVYDLAKLYF